MKLFQADTKIFIDLDGIDLARFEDAHDEEAIGYLFFKSGGSETIRGKAARSLYTKLCGTTESVSEPTLTFPAQPEGIKEGEEGPLDNLVMQKSAFHFNHPITAFVDSKKAWFYTRDQNGRRLIFAFVNAKGSCSVRPFDGDHNVALGKKYGSGDYQIYFADLVKGATALTVDSQPNLEHDCKERLPAPLFKYFQKQIEQIDRS